ncbi:MAG: hypothetical protein ACK4L7_04520 [Flavobacteriales bacterium]
MRLAPALLLAALLPACNGASDQPTANPAAPAAAAASERDAWQKPETVIGLMGNIAHLTIADLFADDGYWTFKFIDAGANVIAVVNDAEKAAALERRKKELGLGDDRLQVRAAPVGDPGIRDEEAHMAFIAHSFVGIKDKRDFLTRMRAGLKYPRYLVMVEWQYKQTAMGPPLSERLPSDHIMDLVGENSEYSDVGAHSDKIPDQVVFLINDYMDPGGDGTEGMIDGSMMMEDDAIVVPYEAP